MKPCTKHNLKNGCQNLSNSKENTPNPLVLMKFMEKRVKERENLMNIQNQIAVVGGNLLKDNKKKRTNPPKKEKSIEIALVLLFLTMKLNTRLNTK